MKDLDGLRTELRYIADEVKPVDLRDRALVTSRRLRRQRSVAVAGGLASIAMVATVLLSLTRIEDLPLPPPPLPIAPSPTYLPSPPTPPTTTMDYGPFNDAFVTVPSWGAADTRCLTGRVRVRSGQAESPSDTKTVLNVLGVVASDVDGDGAQDYVADLSCGEGPESPGRQVVAFRRSGSELTPIAVVVRRNTGDIEMISEIADRGGGRIAVLVSSAYSDSGYEFVPSQWRVYGFGSGRFRQVDGPTSFPADPPGIKVMVDFPIRMEFHATADGQYASELTFRLRNNGELDATNLRMRLFLPPEMHPAGDSWNGCEQSTFPGVNVISCGIPPLAAGGSLQLRFTLVAETMTVTTRGGGFTPVPYVDFDQIPPYLYEKGLPDSMPITMDWPSASARPSPG